MEIVFFLEARVLSLFPHLYTAERLPTSRAAEFPG